MSDIHTDTLIRCLCVIYAFHLSTSNRTSRGNATWVPRQKKFTSKASSWYYYSLVYFFKHALVLSTLSIVLHGAGIKHFNKINNLGRLLWSFQGHKSCYLVDIRTFLDRQVFPKNSQTSARQLAHTFNADAALIHSGANALQWPHLNKDSIIQLLSEQLNPYC